MDKQVLIPKISLKLWNKSEKTKFLLRYDAALPRPEHVENPELPSVQADNEDGIPDLHIPADLLAEFDAILEQMVERNKQSTASAETAQMRQLDTERIRVAKYVVRRVLNGKDLPMAAEREAAQAMETEIQPYKDIAYCPAGQRTADIMGLLVDARKEAFAEHVATLGLAAPLAELQDLNDRYESLSQARKSKQKVKAEKVSIDQLTAKTEEVINNMNNYANAASLLFPSETAATFVRDIIKLYESAREDFKKRGGRGEEDSEKPEQNN